jgi:hypothetical protein
MRWAALLALIALVTTGCQLVKACTLVGCSSGARVKVNRLFSESEAADMNVAACWKETCVSGRMLLPTPGQGGGRATYLTAPGLAANAILWVRSGGYELELEIVVGRELGAPYSLKDGDVYDVHVVAAQGRTLVESRKAAIYGGDFYPNGKGCDKDPCRQASFDVP